MTVAPPRRTLADHPFRAVFTRLSPPDFLIVLCYFAAVLAIGAASRRRNGDAEDFINAGRRMPWPAVLGSLVATEVSAATFLATPGVGFGENMKYLQFGIGSIFARILIAFVFVGAFYAFNSLTIYEFLAHRFGNGSRYTATAFFMVTRLLASAVRLMIAAVGVSLILDLPFAACLAAFTLVAVLYTGAGGIRGIIWTDLLQGVVFISCGLFVLGFIAHAIGWESILRIGSANGRFDVFQWTPGQPGLAPWFNDPKLFGIAVIFGFVSTAAAFGTDQDMTQRMLTCRDARSARRSVILSGCIAIPVAALFLLVGIALFAYYQVHADAELPMRAAAGAAEAEVDADKVFPWFIRHELPPGLRGLLLTGVLAAAMSSLDSTMGALGSSALVDLYRPLRRKLPGKDSGALGLSRLFVAFFGLLLAGAAWLLKDAEGFLWLTFKIGSITYGALLGVFLLGILTRRGDDRGNCLAMVSGALICALLLAGIELGWLALGWTWLILIGTVWTFGLGALRPTQKNPAPAKDGQTGS